MANTTTQAAVTITNSGKIAAVINGQSYTIANDHPKYQEALNALRQKDWNLFVDLVDITLSGRQAGGCDDGGQRGLARKAAEDQHRRSRPWLWEQTFLLSL